MQKTSRLLLLLVIGNQHNRPHDSLLHLPRNLFVRIPVSILYPNQLQQNFPAFHCKIFWEACSCHIT